MRNAKEGTQDAKDIVKGDPLNTNQQQFLTPSHSRESKSHHINNPARQSREGSRQQSNIVLEGSGRSVSGGQSRQWQKALFELKLKKRKNVSVKVNLAWRHPLLPAWEAGEKELKNV